MPTRRFFLAGAAPGNGKLYAIGGIDVNGNSIATCEEYDPGTNTWMSKSPMPTARYGLVAVAVGGIIYAIGGTTDGVNPLATCEAYDPSTNTWTTKSPMPIARFRLAAVASGEMIYAIGGTADGTKPLATCEQYDPVSDSWSEKASIPGPRYGLAVANPGNGKIYALGGSPFYIETCEEYDPSTNTWNISNPTPMPTPRQDLAAAAPGNGKLYAIGGENGGDTLEATAEYTPSASSEVSGDETPIELQLSMFPNPAKNSVTIHADLPKAMELHMEIFDNSGCKLDAESPQIISTSGNDILISTAALTNGTYFIHLFSSRGYNEWGRFIIER
jgi:N-acetylneuraminic acid mutarotase